MIENEIVDSLSACALNLLTSVPQALTQEQLDKQREQVGKHIKIEARLIKRISETMPKIKDEKIKLLLEALSSDQKRHHQLLNEVLAILVKGETIADEEWFEVIWKGVPFQGAPGG